MDFNDRFPNPIPMDPKNKLFHEMDSSLLMVSTITYYWMGVGKLLHVANICLNIAYSIGVAIRIITIFHGAHLDTMIFIFCNLKGFLNFVFHYQWGGDIVLVGFIDSDYLEDLD